MEIERENDQPDWLASLERTTWYTVTEAERRAIERRALAAAYEAMDDVLPPDEDSEAGAVAQAVLRAFSAAGEVYRAANREAEAQIATLDNAAVHTIAWNGYDIVASALWACLADAPIEEVEAPCIGSVGIRGFTLACMALQAAGNLDSAVQDVTDGDTASGQWTASKVKELAELNESLHPDD